MTGTTTKSRALPQNQRFDKAAESLKNNREQREGASNRPFHVIRRGLLKVVIWENQTTNGSMFSTQIIRVYKDGEDWKESHSLNREDLLHAAKMLDAADTIIHREEEERRQPQEQRQGE